MVSQIKLERIKRELSQLELETKTGIPQWRISLIERGIRPRRDELEKLSIALKVNTDTLSPNLNEEEMAV